MRGKFVLFSCTGKLLKRNYLSGNQLNTNLNICLKRTKVAKQFNTIGCYEVLLMASARALHMLFVNNKLVKN